MMCSVNFLKGATNKSLSFQVRDFQARLWLLIEFLKKKSYNLRHIKLPQENFDDYKNDCKYAKEKVAEKEVEDSQPGIILDGSSYALKYILTDEYKINKDLHWFRNFFNFFKKNKNDDLQEVPNCDFSIPFQRLQENEQNEFLHYTMNSFPFLTEIQKKDIMNCREEIFHASQVNYKKKEYLITPLISKYIGRTARVNTDISLTLPNYLEQEKKNTDFVLTFFGFSLFGFGARETAEEALPHFIEVLAKAGELIIDLTLPGLMIIGTSTLFGYLWKKKKPDFHAYIKAFHAWNNIEEIKKRAICLQMDERFHLPPNSSYEFLSGWLGVKKVLQQDEFQADLERKLKNIDLDIINKFTRDFPEINEQINSLKERINNIEIKYDRKFEENENDHLRFDSMLMNQEKEIAELRKSTIEPAINKNLLTLKSNYVLQKNYDFVQRDIMKEIDFHLQNKDANSVTTIVLCGSAGVGKTQLALQYAYQNRDYYDLIGWLKSEDSLSLKTDFLKLRENLNLQSKGRSEKDVEEVKVKIAKNISKWLLIFDNATSPDSLRSYIPISTAGNILITTRNELWQSSNEKIFHIEEFSQREARDYFISQLKYTNEASKNEDVNNLAEMLDRLPLALGQACAYIRNSSITIKDYIHSFEANPKELLNKGRLNQSVYPETIYCTCMITISALRKKCPTAVYVLKLCSFLAPDDIPLDLIKKAPEFSDSSVQEVFSTDMLLNEAVASLRQYSLLRYQNNRLSIHRLTQLIARDTVDNQGNMLSGLLVFKKGTINKQRNQWIKSILKSLFNLLPDEINKKENREIYDRLLPHITHVTELAGKLNMHDVEIDEESVLLLIKASEYLLYSSDFKKVIEYQNIILETCKRTKDPKSIAKGYINEGDAYQNLGNYPKALDCYSEGLKICETLKDLSGKSKCFRGKGNASHNLCKYIDAIKFQTESMKICKEIGDLHGESSCNINMGVSYYRLGYFEKDITFQKTALKLNSSIKDQRCNSNCYMNLGNAYYGLGKYDEAIAYLQSSLKIYEEIGDLQGKSYCFCNLGAVYHSIGVANNSRDDYDKAIEFEKESLRINREIGDREGETKCYCNLGIIHNSLKEYDDAISYQNLSLEICEKIFDQQGKSNCFCNLGMIYLCRGRINNDRSDYEKAIECQETSLKISRKIHDRQCKIRCYRGLADIYSSLGEVEKSAGFTKRKKI